jgi:hypothetical protein
MTGGDLAKAALLFSAAVRLLASPARADAIDGNWCSPDQRHLAIAGPRITTPGGARIAGRYDRHGFLYTVPEGEPHAGAQVLMDLMDENTVHLRMRGGDLGEATSPVEVWKRCEMTS